MAKRVQASGAVMFQAHEETTMNSSVIAPSRRSGTFLVLAFLLLGAAVSPAAAQITTTGDIVASTGFSVPVASVVPNPCSGGFVLANGQQDVQVTTVIGSGGTFVIKLNFHGTGVGYDALANGSVIVGTQSTPYIYSSTAGVEIGFSAVPSYYMITLPVASYLKRQPATVLDAFTMKASLELTFNNGVPAVPTIRAINVKCG
jgi:hypothetical protein